ncbi:apolipoprotein C-I [Dipodomys spectabilis]|uniref:apolipoprotein C-I n=1 Tax=Dipodomys spectabilis TaxID=105255 RepID=UPI001C54ADDB|nr:apolipoprotein C-I [Dipodomys spectabilis]XP_042556244.1 apolipoprotein C-I [Dipodomys spectabilis]
MRLYLSLPVLLVALCVALEGPAPAQAAPDFSSTLEKVKEIGNTLENKTRTTIDRIKNSEFLAKTRSWISEKWDKAKEKIRGAFS